MPSSAPTARSGPARSRICGRTLVPFGGRCTTTSTAAEKFGGSAATRFRKASIPPADAPTTIVWTRRCSDCADTPIGCYALKLVDVAVHGPFDLGGERQLVGAVDDDQPLRAARTEGVDGLVLREVPSLGRLGAAQRRLAEEDIGVLRELDEAVARAGVAGVG